MTCGLQNREATAEPAENTEVTFSQSEDSPTAPPTEPLTIANISFTSDPKPDFPIVELNLINPNEVLRFVPTRWKHFEDHRVRRTKNIRWHTLPLWSNEGYFHEMFVTADGATLYGVLLSLIRLGFVGGIRGALVTSECKPLSINQIAFLSRIPKSVLTPSIHRLLETNWLEVTSWPIAQTGSNEGNCKIDYMPRRSAPAGPVQQVKVTNAKSFSPELDRALIAVTQMSFDELPAATQKKLRDFICRYSEKKLIASLEAEVKASGADATLQNALFNLGFGEAAKKKRAKDAEGFDSRDIPDW